MLARRDYSEKQLLDKLLARGIDAGLAQVTVSALKDDGYLDDTRYAERIIESRLARKPYGRLYLLSLLQQAGINKSTAQNTLERLFDPEEELKQALRFLKRHGEKGAAPKRLYALLERRGFTRSTVFRALREEYGSHLDITDENR